MIGPELMERSANVSTSPRNWKAFRAEEVFEIQRGHFHSISALDAGEYPTISRVSTDNGFVGFYDAPEGAEILEPETITVSTVAGDAFVQPVPFIATDNIVLCNPLPQYKHLSVASLHFIAVMLNMVKWRYSYGRQCYKTKFVKTEFLLPITEEGKLDEAYMETLVKNAAYWPLVEAVYKRETGE
jgi:type I restriction enzyme M protein